MRISWNASKIHRNYWDSMGNYIRLLDCTGWQLVRGEVGPHPDNNIYEVNRRFLCKVCNLKTLLPSPDMKRQSEKGRFQCTIIPPPRDVTCTWQIGWHRGLILPNLESVRISPVNPGIVPSPWQYRQFLLNFNLESAWNKEDKTFLTALEKCHLVDVNILVGTSHCKTWNYI